MFKFTEDGSEVDRNERIHFEQVEHLIKKVIGVVPDQS
jgi:hypothetical protein